MVTFPLSSSFSALEWFANPLPYDSIIRYSMPVLTGAFSDPFFLLKSEMSPGIFSFSFPPKSSPRALKAPPCMPGISDVPWFAQKRGYAPFFCEKLDLSSLFAPLFAPPIVLLRRARVGHDNASAVVGGPTSFNRCFSSTHSGTGRLGPKGKSATTRDQHPKGPCPFRSHDLLDARKNCRRDYIDNTTTIILAYPDIN